jgi:hypothetical protein
MKLGLTKNKAMDVDKSAEMKPLLFRFMDMVRKGVGL